MLINSQKIVNFSFGIFILSILICSGFSIAWAQTDYVGDEVIIKFKSSSEGKVIVASQIKEGIIDQDFESKALAKKMGLKKIKIPPGKNISEYIDLICNNSGDDKGKLGNVCNNNEIDLIQPNYVYHISMIPNDPYFGNQWGPVSINATNAWDYWTGSPDAVIAIVDTGVRYTHEDLAPNMWDDGLGSPGYDFVNNDNDPADDHEHGTLCAGVAAAVGNNGKGIAGITWSSKIMAVKVLDSGGNGNTDDVANGIIYAADKGAHIISMSFGGSSGDAILQNAVDYAYNKGCVLVGAGGNSGASSIEYPAAYSNVIAVGFIDESDVRDPGSNYGSALDLVAPGVNIQTTHRQSDTSYAYYSGSSAATPHVSGVAALVKSLYPSLTNIEIKDRLESTATDLGAAGWDIYYGHGKVDAYESLALSVVNIDTGQNFQSIQIAIDDPGTLNGHTLELLSQNYQENIVVTKSLTIRSAVGMSKIDGLGAQNTVKIEADNVILENLEITDAALNVVSQTEAYYGTQVINSIVHGSTSYDCIQLLRCTDCLINNVIAYNCNGNGFSIAEGSANGLISNSEVYGCSGLEGAIYTNKSSDITIKYNHVHDCTASNGILLYEQNSGTNIIKGNIIENNIFGTKSGFETHYSNGITVYNPQTGSNSIISYNQVTNNNDDGISISNSLESNSLFRNDLTGNGNNGVFLSNSANTMVYHNNFVSNTAQAFDDGTNTWDNGYPSGGNYWNDWITPDDFSGENQDIVGSDGIVDDPYSISGGLNKDNYPHTSQNGWIIPNPITWYFAEGYTGSGFYESLVLLNPTQNPSNIDITYMFDDATTQSQSLSILQGHRTTIDVNSVVGPNKAVSVRVDADQAVVAERPMLFKYGGNIPGAHSTQAVTAPSTVWYFAEGYTGSEFYEFLTLQNPNGSPADVDVTYMFDDGSTQLQQISISADTRYTVNVNSIVGAGKAVSMKVTSAQPIIAERPMYFNYAGSIPGGHVTIGATELSTIWYFAEGWTGSGFYEYLTLMNPNDVGADITITYMFDDGTTQTSNFPMLAHQRYTVNVNSAVGANMAVSIKVESTVGIVAERPIYFNYAGTTKGAHDTIGGTLPKNIWYFADGETNSGTDMYVTIMNPDSANTASITVTYMFPDDSSQQEVISVLPTQRYTIKVNNQVGSGKEVSVKLDSAVSIFAERPMYYNNWNGLGIDGGTAVLGFAP